MFWRRFLLVLSIHKVDVKRSFFAENKIGVT
nr:MAG TPA: hypothetical protein [Caudoviricetes sp.]